MTIEIAYATPDVLVWARDSAGLQVHEAAAKIGLPAFKLQAAEEGVDWLTLRQAEELADVYERPLAVLFRDRPPEEEEPAALFRRLPGAPELPWPSEMRLLARRVRQRQDAAAEIEADLEETPTWHAAVARFRVVAGVPSPLRPSVIREMLAVDLSRQRRAATRTYGSFNLWREAVEALGVLVMQDGSMELSVMRGFAAEHVDVPAIVVNNKDTPRARAFTILHEFAHLFYGVIGYPHARRELAANELAGEIIMPGNAFTEAFNEVPADTDPLDKVDGVASVFGVTAMAAAIRAKRLNLLRARDADAVIRMIRGRKPKPRGEGGDYYAGMMSRLGPAFINLVFSALDTQVVTYPEASALLADLNVSRFERMRDRVRSRPIPR